MQSLCYELTGASKLYRQGPTTIRAVDQVDLTIGSGEFLVIHGASGSGKTTLLQLLGGLEVPTSGAVRLEGIDLSNLSDKDMSDLRLRALGFIFQQFNLIPTLTAQENVEAAMAPTHVAGSARRSRAQEILTEVGLLDRSRHLPAQMSGGEQQRVAIARALANRPRVILADEPTGNLDSKTGAEIISLLRSLSSRYGQTVVLVTHDREAAAGSSRVENMIDGRLT